MSQSGTLHVVDTNTGNLRLDYSMVSISNGSPTMLGNLVYSADEAGGIRAVDWRKRVLPFEKSARWLRTQLFIWGMINSISPQKGYVWADRIRGGGFSSTPVIANGALYIGSHGEELLAFDAETGEPLWEFRDGRAGSRIGLGGRGHGVRGRLGWHTVRRGRRDREAGLAVRDRGAHRLHARYRERRAVSHLARRHAVRHRVAAGAGCGYTSVD